ncbi:MAG: hypothetical protein EPN34_04450 [Burkholderiaceae bacterium]|nr:MAG: hypothetical protein EPN34_04450 [Burkholderiaceae bacterium]
MQSSSVSRFPRASRIAENAVAICAALLTADSADTNAGSWALLLGLKGVIAQQEICGLRHRVGRGMRASLSAAT